MRASYFSWLGLLLILQLFGASAAQALSVEHVRFGVHPGKSRMVLDLSEQSEFRAFLLSDPYRLVIDLPTFNWRAGQIADLDKAGIAAVRQGILEPGISRIVFDLKSPAVIRAAFILPRQQGHPDRLVVDFARSSPQAFETAKNSIHGRLSNRPGHLQAPSGYQQASVQAMAPPASPAPQPAVKPPFEKPLIVLDPGHGGVDPGAIGANKAFEKNVVLALAKEVKRQLESSGRYRVLLTRDKDVFIKLSDRVKFARTHGADLFVSIHADTIPKSHVRGASIYTLSEKASDDQTEKLAARENRVDLIAGVDLSAEDQDVANILVDLAMRDTMNQSKFFANTVVDKFGSGGIRTLEKPHRYAGFAVLKAPDIPSVLVEAGFMSNPQEASLLLQDSHRRKVAAALKDGIDAYFEKVRQNQRS